jgi:hypothetical protein
VTLTLTNKSIFQFGRFGHPLTLTAVHYACTSVGALVACSLLQVVTDVRWADGYSRGRRCAVSQLPPAKLDRRGNLQLIAFSLVFNMNVFLGNAGIHAAPVSVSQTVRTIIPATTILFSWLFMGTRWGAPSSASASVLRLANCSSSGLVFDRAASRPEPSPPSFPSSSVLPSSGASASRRCFAPAQ